MSAPSLSDNETSLLIRGGRVIDPASKVDRQADLLVVCGRVTRIAKGIAQAERVIDARDRWVVPGLIDIHVHLRDPGQEYKEDIASGTRAAAAGGVTSLCCMANTRPVNDTRAVTEYIVNRVKAVGCVRVYPLGAISRGLRGEALCEYADMKEAGIVAVSDDGLCVMDAGVMRRALEYAKTFDLVVAQHCEDHRLACGGVMHEGAVATRLGLPGQPAQAESAIVARDIELAELTGARYHACHLSTAAAFRYIRQAKERGLPVSCEVAVHHVALTDDACSDYDTDTKVNPPLRPLADLAATKAAIAEGLVDALVTDHAPHAIHEKEMEYGNAPFGISGLETLVPLALDLWREGVVSVPNLVALLTERPARVMGIAGGTLAVGAPADIAVIDPARQWVVDPERFVSKGKNTPFKGRTVTGAVTATVVGGRVVFAQAD